MDIARDLLDKLPIDDIATELGVSREEVEDAIAVGAPTLLKGLNAEASSSPETARSVLQALAEDHGGQVLDSDNPLGEVDRSDGEKIVRHIFGDSANTVTERLGAADTNKAPSGLFAKILPMIAPLVMSWISRKLGGAAQGKSDEPGGLGGLLGDLLGGGDGGGVGDAVDDILGRGAEGNAGGFDMGGLTDMLGDLAGSSGSAGRDIPDMSDILGQLGGKS